MTSDYDKPGPSGACNVEHRTDNEAETQKYNYDNCIVRFRSDDECESSDDENNDYNILHAIDGNNLVLEYRNGLNEDDEDDKRINRILDYIYSDKETLSESESSFETESQYKSFHDFISMLSGVEPSSSEEDEETDNHEPTSSEEISNDAEISTHEQKQDDSVDNDDINLSQQQTVAFSDAQNLLKSPKATTSKSNAKDLECTKNLPIVLLHHLPDPLIKKKVVKRKMTKIERNAVNSKTIKSKANDNSSSSDDENTNVPFIKTKKPRCKTKVTKKTVSNNTEYDITDESDDEKNNKTKKQTTKLEDASKLNNKTQSEDNVINNDSQASDILSNIRNILEQSMINQNQKLDKTNTDYERIINIINEYTNNKDGRSESTVKDTDVTKQVLLEQSNKSTTSSVSNVKKDIKGSNGGEGTDGLFSDEGNEHPMSIMSPRRSQRILTSLSSANESTKAVTSNSSVLKTSQIKNKNRKQLKCIDEETTNINLEADKNNMSSNTISAAKPNPKKTIKGSEETKQVSLKQSNKNTTSSAANHKKSINCKDTEGLFSDEGNEQPISMMSPRRSQRLLTSLSSANESTKAMTNNSCVRKTSGIQNKNRKQMKSIIADEETADLQADKNHMDSKESSILQKKKLQRRGNDSKSKDDVSNVNEVRTLKKPRRLNFPEAETTNELQTAQKNVKAKQPQSFNEISDHINNDDGLSPIIKSRMLPMLRSSRNQSAIMGNTKNMTSTPNENMRDRMKNIVIGSAISMNSDSIENAKKLPTTKNDQNCTNDFDDDAKENVINANVEGPMQRKVSTRTLKELQNKEKLVTKDSEEDNSSNEIEGTQKTESVNGQLIGIKGKAQIKKIKEQSCNIKQKVPIVKIPIIKDVEGKGQEINPIVTDSKMKESEQSINMKTSNKTVKVSQNTKKSRVPKDAPEDEVNCKGNKTEANATSVIRNETKATENQQLTRNKPKYSTRKVNKSQNMKKTIFSSSSEEQDSYIENEDKGINANTTCALKQGTNNKKDQPVIGNKPKTSIKKVAGKQNTKRALVSNFEEQDTCNEKKVQDIEVKEIETNVNSTSPTKKGRNYKKGQQIMSNKPKASTSKVKDLQNMQKVHTAFDEQGCCNETEGNEVNSTEDLNSIVASTSQKRTKTSENKQLKKKKGKLKESPKKNTTVAVIEQDLPNEIDEDTVKTKANKNNTNVASTSKKEKSAERKTITASKRKLKETPIAVELEDISTQKKLKLVEATNSNTTISTNDEIDELDIQERINRMQNSSKFDRDFSLHNEDILSVKKESGLVYDKQLQRLCDELNASRKSFDFSFENSTLNDSVRRSGRSRKPPKLSGLMYIQPIDYSDSGKKRTTRKTLSQTPFKEQKATDQENDDNNERNVQVNDEIASQIKEKKTSSLKSPAMKKRQSNEETNEEDLGNNEASCHVQPKKKVGRKNSKSHVKSKTSQDSAKKKKTSEEDSVDSSQDNNESTADSLISNQSTSNNTTTVRKKRKLFSPEAYLNSSAIIKCCEHTQT